MLPSILPLLVVPLLISAFSISSHADEAFDVRRHLSTVSSYGAVKDIAGDSYVPSKIPAGCTAIHLNLVARHGTRAPTKKRIKELDRLAELLKTLAESAKKQKSSPKKVPTWFDTWESPWKGKKKGGELISKGEEELYQLGLRVKERFPDLFADEYHPDVYSIRATQVPRASASAVAFGLGLLSERGNLGPGKHRGFAISTESRASDLVLRFFDTCQSYKDYRKSQEPAVQKLKGPVFDEIADSLSRQYGLNFTSQIVSSLWFLCKQEASLLDTTNQACGLFNPREVALLEWTDDLEGFVLKGYGNSVNYRMGVPLLNDVFESMEVAIQAHEEGHPTGSYEKAKLRFAHAETVVPFSCLLGLFLEGSEFEAIQREQSLQLPPKPPQKRSWRGNIVAPFAGNNMLVLHSCPANSSSKYYVQVLHNEHPIPMPGCQNSDFCPFETFKENIVLPHRKSDYNAICSVKLEKPDQKGSTGILSMLFGWLSPTSVNGHGNLEDDEL